ncbi:cytochrome P450 [Rhodococcoides yunnanense]|uniref:cytochrome P450 n=1 Tax=Rhodococcoides yunnanense TaxID=278209 RepID=UPI001114AAB9|nr:cytochrome P450 [Rhodococcus yunnanensis]
MTTTPADADADTTHLGDYPFPRTCPFAQADRVGKARDAVGTPIVRLEWLDEDVVYVTRYDDVRALLASPHVSSKHSVPKFPSLVRERAYRGGPSPIVQSDPPVHGPLRRIIAPELAPKSIAGFRPEVEKIVADAIAHLESFGSEPVDLMTEFAQKIPSAVMCTLWGLPQEMAPVFAKLLISDIEYGVGQEKTRGQLGAHEFAQRLGQHIAENPDASKTVQRINAAIADGSMSILDGIVLGSTVFGAGFDTTYNMIGAAIVEFLRSPEKGAYFLEATDEQAYVAINEMMRYISAAHLGVGRMATADIELPSGIKIAEGQGIIVSLEGANHDPAQFDQPEDMDLERQDNNHLGFGFGLHQCPGQHLARLELILSLKAILRHFPHLRLAVEEDELRYTDEAEIRGPAQLPVVLRSA